MLRPVWCNNGGTKSSACRSCILVYSRVMIFWFSNTVYFLHDGSEFIFYWGWQLCDAIVWAWLDCQARVSTCMPEVLKTDFAWQFHLVRLVQERCNSCGKPFLPFASLSMLSKKMQTGKKRINDDPMLITLGTNPCHGSTVTNWLEKDAARQQQTNKVAWRKVVIVHRLTLD